MRYVRFSFDNQTPKRGGLMLHCDANPTRQPSRSAPAAVVTTYAGPSRSATMASNACASAPNPLLLPGSRPTRLVGLVVHDGGALDADGKAEAVDGAAAHGAQAVHLVGRDVDEVARSHRPFLVVDGHDTAPRHDEIPLVRRVTVGEHGATRRHLELVDQLHEPAVGQFLYLPGVDKVPHGHSPVVLDLRLAID